MTADRRSARGPRGARVRRTSPGPGRPGQALLRWTTTTDTGRFLDERLGRIHFWTLFVGFQATFLVQHWLGELGMPRRYADYLAADGFTLLNTVSSIGAFLLGLSTLPFLYNVWTSARHGRTAGTDDPWGYGRSLEWATSCPPPRHNFTALPRIRSESPAFDLHHPDVVRRERQATDSRANNRANGRANGKANGKRQTAN